MFAILYPLLFTTSRVCSFSIKLTSIALFFTSPQLQYIDFGPHPGMDRLPREATLAGCVVITNREGAANFDEDVPLPSEFKFSKFNVDKIYSLIIECCTKHDEYASKMDKYKSWILAQRVQMKACVDGMVNEVVTTRIGNCKKV